MLWGGDRTNGEKVDGKKRMMGSQLWTIIWQDRQRHLMGSSNLYRKEGTKTLLPIQIKGKVC